MIQVSEMIIRYNILYTFNGLYLMYSYNFQFLILHVLKKVFGHLLKETNFLKISDVLDLLVKWIILANKNSHSTGAAEQTFVLYLINNLLFWIIFKTTMWFTFTCKNI